MKRKAERGRRGGYGNRSRPLLLAELSMRVSFLGVIREKKENAVEICSGRSRLSLYLTMSRDEIGRKENDVPFVHEELPGSARPLQYSHFL